MLSLLKYIRKARHCPFCCHVGRRDSGDLLLSCFGPIEREMADVRGMTSMEWLLTVSPHKVQGIGIYRCTL